MNKAIKILLPAVLAGLVLSSGALATTGCGSSKPAFCGERDQLEQSVKGLTDISPTSASVTDYENQLNEIQTDADQTLESAREDFPQETEAVESSINGLSKSIEDLPDSPSTGDYIQLVGEATGVASAVSQFVKATNSACN